LLSEYKSVQCDSKAVTINIFLGESSLKTCPFCSLQLSSVEIGGRERLACGNCDFVHWNNPKPVTATVISMDGGIVLVKRKFEPFVGDWCLPGGFIEATEHPAESAAREVFEETGLEVRVSRLLDAGAPGRGINVVILFYEALPTAG
jgi:NADH pyrophosphatase NudC (nudix superfamily)